MLDCILAGSGSTTWKQRTAAPGHWLRGDVLERCTGLYCVMRGNLDQQRRQYVDQRVDSERRATALIPTGRECYITYVINALGRGDDPAATSNPRKSRFGP
jgi:hypothetical protein